MKIGDAESLSATPSSNLPRPLKYPVGSLEKPSKEKTGEWIAADELEKYLLGNIGELQTAKNEEFYNSEARISVEISPKTGTAAKGKLFSVEYLRMKPEVSMVVFAQCEARKYGENQTKDVLEELFKIAQKHSFTLGGQQGVAYMQGRCCKKPFRNTTAHGCNVKWVLLTPTCFNAGWLPGWIQDGKVMLKSVSDTSGQAMTRKEKREKLNASPTINAKLVAARIDKPRAVSGWKNIIGGGPKSTKYLVPAGSVYYFECENEAEAGKLIAALHGNPKSDLFGEQGFGIGVCSKWDFIDFKQTQNNHK
jgi:CRISPR-associated protein Cmr3